MVRRHDGEREKGEGLLNASPRIEVDFACHGISDLLPGN